MSQLHPYRADIARQANAAAENARMGTAPQLTGDSNREAVIAWLQWNDRNGCYTDADCEAEGMEPLTEIEAWDLLADACEYGL